MDIFPELGCHLLCFDDGSHSCEHAPLPSLDVVLFKSKISEIPRLSHIILEESEDLESNKGDGVLNQLKVDPVLPILSSYYRYGISIGCVAILGVVVDFILGPAEIFLEEAVKMRTRLS